MKLPESSLCFFLSLPAKWRICFYHNGVGWPFRAALFAAGVPEFCAVLPSGQMGGRLIPAAGAQAVLCPFCGFRAGKQPLCRRDSGVPACGLRRHSLSDNSRCSQVFAFCNKKSYIRPEICPAQAEFAASGFCAARASLGR